MRLLSPDVTAAALDHEPLPPEDVVDGSPTAAVLTLDTSAARGGPVGDDRGHRPRHRGRRGLRRGLRRGQVTFEDGERIDLAPGVAVRLTAGERTVWTVTERVRKIWVA